MLRLFLQNYEIELTEDIQVAITKQFEDITNPTSIINDWSKTVKIPATSQNNKIFGHLNNVDKLTVSGSGSTGVYFDPYKKIDFRLQWGDAIVMTGYAKNVSCDKDYYNLTLNGELGKVFQEMKKITFDKTTDDTKYLIDGSQYVDETINKDLIYRLWNNEPDFENLNLIEKYIWSFNATTGEKVKQINGAYRTQNYLGFAPNNSFESDFDYKTFQKDGQNTSMKLSEVLDERVQGVENNTEATYQSVVGIAADTVIGNGMLPREIGEYRSYMQLPYIYWNKLFQIFTKKAKEITGYDCILNQDWFNKTNPYWNRTIYTLEKLNKTTNGKAYNSDLNITLCDFIKTDSANGYYTPAISSTRSNITWNSITNNSTFLQEVKTDFKAGKFDNITFSQNIPVKLSFTGVYTNGSLATWNYLQFDNSYFMYVNFRLKDSNGNVVFTNTPIAIHNQHIAQRENEVVINGVPLKSAGQYETTVEIPFRMTIDRNTVGDDFDIEVAVYCTTYTDVNMYLVNSLSGGDIVGVNPNNIKFTSTGSLISVNTSNNKRSFSQFTLNDLWNNKVNLFDEILNYCKMHRIGIFCDYFNKQIIFKPLNSYFNDYTIEDWTEKVDLSKDYHIEPITFDNKYVKFNYGKNETELNKQYNDKFGLNFGEYKLTTQYEFNTSEKELFKNVKSVIPTTDMVLSWNNLYDNLKIVYTLPAEITISNKDKDNKTKDVFGSMLFFNANRVFDNTNGLRSVSITDDTDFQTYNQTYFYTQNGQEGRYIKSQKYPELDIVYDKQLCTFATPLENYTYKANRYNNRTGIYENFWKNYLDERYNVQNKIVTCYIYLKPSDYINFSFNKFVKINNQIYMVNKIYDYDITSSAPTKVDLITIQNIEGYTKALTFDWFQLYNSKQQAWDYYRDYITLTDVGQTQTIYVTSSKPVTWTDTSSALQSMLVYYNNDESNATNASGTIPAGEKIPVTFKMVEPYDEFGDVIFKSGDKEFKVSVALIYDETFEVYFKNTAGNYVTWSNDDYIDLRDEDETFTLYISSDEFTPVTWRDVDSSLQDLYINGTNGSGSIPAGDKVPVVFSVRDLIDSEGTIRFTNGHKDINVFVRIKIDKTFTIYDSDKTVWASTDKVDLQNTGPTMKTIYITTPNVPLYWEIMSSDLHGLGVCVDDDINDWGCYEFTRGVIPIGTMIPVTFRMNPEGDVNTINGQIRFYNTEISKTINVRLFWAEIFTVYNSNGEVWDEEVDYILLGGTDITKTIYLTANSDVEWYDDSSELQNLYIYSGEDPGDYGDYDRGNGVIPKPSNMKPIYFRLDPTAIELGSSGNIMLFNGRHEWKIPVRLYEPDVPALNGITVYRSDKQPWDFDFDYIELEPHTSKTIYMTSTTDIEWGSDVNIQNNVEVNGEVGYGQIQAGNQVAITFFNDEFTPCEGYIRFENQYQQYVEIFVRIK